MRSAELLATCTERTPSLTNAWAYSLPRWHGPAHADWRPRRLATVFESTIAMERLPTFLNAKPTFATFAAFTKRPTEQPVEVTCFKDPGRIVPVKSEAEKAADAKREKAERKASRRARKVAKQMVMQRRRERAADAMAELDAEEVVS